jgi:hypothetical protein
MEKQMTEIYLNRRELKEIIELLERTVEDEAVQVKITSDNSSGIGSVVTATVPVKVNEYHGEFTVTISDENDW